MTKIYNFDYSGCDAEVQFKVNDEILTAENAKLLLDFFTWEYDEENDIIEELLKKYALEVIRVSSLEDYNVLGVKRWFKDQEGFITLDGKYGVELILLNPYSFNEDLIEITVQNVENQN